MFVCYTDSGMVGVAITSLFCYLSVSMDYYLKLISKGRNCPQAQNASLGAVVYCTKTRLLFEYTYLPNWLKMAREPNLYAWFALDRLLENKQLIEVPKFMFQLLNQLFGQDFSAITQYNVVSVTGKAAIDVWSCTRNIKTCCSIKKVSIKFVKVNKMRF